MQSTMINSTLKSKWNAGRSAFDVDLHDVDTYGYSTYNYNNYLFLKRELEVTADGWRDAKKNGMIRHAKLYKGKFLDYVVGKQFDTIEEWVKDAGGKMEDVLYGENRVTNRFVSKYDYRTKEYVQVPYSPKYVKLSTMLEKMGYVAPPPPVEVPAHVVLPEVNPTDLLTMELQKRGITIDNVYVLNGGAIVPWTTFMNQ